MYRNIIRGVFGDLLNMDDVTNPQYDLSAKAVDSLTRNLREPVKSGTDKFRGIYGTLDEQLAAYKDFVDQYKYAVELELKNNGKRFFLSDDRKAQLVKALKSDDAKVDLSLLNIESRRRLEDLFNINVMKTQRLIEEYGLPGVMLPSSNANRGAARMLVSTEGDEFSPILRILQDSTFSIDPARQVSSMADLDSSVIKIGTSNLPSYSDLLNQSRQSNLTPQNIVGKRVFFLDTETTGVTNLDIVRSISVQESTVGPNGRFISRGEELGARFDTAQMSEYLAADPKDLRRTTTLSDAIITKEMPTDDPSAARLLASRRYDLTTEVGRGRAKEYYTDLLQKLTQDDVLLGTHNGQFDVRMIIASARSVGVDEKLLDSLESKVASGGLIDTLGMARNKLSNELASYMENLDPRFTAEMRTRKATEFLLSDEALMASRRLGEGVKFFGLENLVESSNFLEILAQRADDGDVAADKVLKRLSSSSVSHTDVVDQMVTGQLYTAIDELTSRRLDSRKVSAARQKEIRAARINVRSSKAVVETTNLVDPRYLTENTFRYLTETDAIQNVQLDVNLQQVGINRDEYARLRYDRQSKKFQLFDLSSGQKIDAPDSVNTESLLRREINRIRRVSFDAPLVTPGGNQSVVHTLGINPIEMRNVESVFSTIKEMRQQGGIGLVTDVGSKDDRAIINALTAVRQHIGFNYMPVAPNDSQIAMLMRGQNEVISQESRAAYTSAVRLMGIGAASMDPGVRSMFVATSKATSNLTGQNETYFTRLFESAGMLQTDADREVLSGFMRNTLSKQSNLFAELEILTTRSIEKSFTARSGLFFITPEMLENITVTSGDKTVTLAERVQSGTSRLSTATTSSGVRVNLVYGGDVVREGLTQDEQLAAIEDAKREADAIFDYQRERILNGAISDQDAVAQFGMSEADATAAKQSFRDRYVKRGMVYGSVADTEGAQELSAMLSQGTDSDVVNVQRGFRFRAVDINEGFITALPDIDPTVTRAASALAGEVIDPIADRQSLIVDVLTRAQKSPTFLKEFNATVGKIKGRGKRNLRDQEILERMAKIKPGVYIGAVAATAIGAGYYLARKREKENLYEEVMEPQDTELNIGPMGVSEFNKIDQQMASQSSSRRDPLMTAGVVGNLDRQKISHYKMGPKKYDHLYSQ